ncbi:MAG: SIS domain-containing protein [Planctomycetota bacterium]
MVREKFLKEVLEQPEALTRALDHYFGGEGRSRGRGIARAARICAGARGGIVFTGMGSSYYAGMIAAHILNENGRSASAWEAGELFYYNLGALERGTTLVAVSQSGATIEMAKIVEAVRGEVKIIAVTNNPRSRIARAAHVVLPLVAGEERMSTSKTYVNTIAVLSILAWALAGKLDEERKDELREAARLLALELEGHEKKIRKLTGFVGGARFLHLVARGPSLSTALQGQVILKEGAHILTEAQSGASFRHGPFEIIEKGHRAMVFAGRGRTEEIMLRLVRDMVRFGSKVILVTNSARAEATKNVLVYRLPEVKEHVFPILDIVPVELLLVGLARKRGVEPGAITKGNKVTVRE